MFGSLPKRGPKFLFFHSVPFMKCLVPTYSLKGALVSLPAANPSTPAERHANTRPPTSCFPHSYWCNLFFFLRLIFRPSNGCKPGQPCGVVLVVVVVRDLGQPSGGGGGSWRNGGGGAPKGTHPTGGAARRGESAQRENVITWSRSAFTLMKRTCFSQWFWPWSVISAGTLANVLFSIRKVGTALLLLKILKVIVLCSVDVSKFVKCDWRSHHCLKICFSSSTTQVSWSISFPFIQLCVICSRCLFTFLEVEGTNRKWRYPFVFASQFLKWSAIFFFFSFQVVTRMHRGLLFTVGECVWLTNLYTSTQLKF